MVRHVQAVRKQTWTLDLMQFAEAEVATKGFHIMDALSEVAYNDPAMMRGLVRKGRPVERSVDQVAEMAFCPLGGRYDSIDHGRRSRSGVFGRVVIATWRVLR